LRTLKSLEISIDVEADSPVVTPSQGKAKAPDINSVLDSLKKRTLKKQI
jgi:predicted S18 family serine protease